MDKPFYTGLTGQAHKQRATCGVDYIGRWEYIPGGLEFKITPEAEIADVQAVVDNSDEWCRVRALDAEDANRNYDAAFEQWQTAQDSLVGPIV